MAFFMGKDIAINCWKEIPKVEDYFHFFTHVNSYSASAPVGLFDKIKPIYTSSFIAWYLFNYLGVPKTVFQTFDFGVEYEMYKNGKEITFEFVTSSSLKPSFMILFKNEMGDELFVGNCKLTLETLSVRSMLPYLSNKSLKKLYFNGSYMNCSQIPAFDRIVDSIITAIRMIGFYNNALAAPIWYSNTSLQTVVVTYVSWELGIPELECWSHNHKTVYISTNILGQENILTTIAQTFDKKIYVCPEKYGVLQKLGLHQYFTTESCTTSFRCIGFNQISKRKVLERNKLNGPSITIVLSIKAYLANYEHREDFKQNGILFFPLTSLNTPSELQFLKNIMTEEYVLTNHLTNKSISSFSSNECSLNQNKNSHPYKQFRLRRYSKHKTSAGKIQKELEKCGPEYYMSWSEYLKWRRNNFNNTL